MSNAQDSQAYDTASWQWVRGADGLTYIMTPAGQTILAVAWFPIPNINHDKASIDRLVSEFKDGPSKGANKVICSKCHGEGNHNVWDPKPASLKRHLYYHFNIKCYGCVGCGQQFMTRDHVIVHAMGHHMESNDRTAAVGYVFELHPDDS
ncbi:unnamed protein product [Rhizoctonia solani]|uniref:C2H2-type domain-containing protein n=1 Tax=Rhizoctonia solani TaxID=456999 RepID=A0A8H2WZH2_9AGAM|nr:unnamed protein product [Rhizoctonia solani]